MRVGGQGHCQGLARGVQGTPAKSHGPHKVIQPQEKFVNTYFLQTSLGILRAFEGIQIKFLGAPESTSGTKAKALRPKLQRVPPP